MIYAEKGNKVVSIPEECMDSYAKDGFDIKDENGKILKHATNKKVAYEEYEKLLEEVKLLKEENEKLKAELEAKEATAKKK